MPELFTTLQNLDNQVQGVGELPILFVVIAGGVVGLIFGEDVAGYGGAFIGVYLGRSLGIAASHLINKVYLVLHHDNSSFT